MFKKLLLFIVLLILPALACSYSSANISSAKMARDSDGNDVTTVFKGEDTFYAIVELANAPDDTSVKVVWTAVAVEGADPDTYLDEYVFANSEDGILTFNIENDSLWPVGRYKADVYLNDELNQTLEFEVK